MFSQRLGLPQPRSHRPRHVWLGRGGGRGEGGKGEGKGEGKGGGGGRGGKGGELLTCKTQ